MRRAKRVSGNNADFNHDRRRHERAGTDLYVNKIIGDEPHLVRMLDLSEGGAYLQRILEPDLECARVGLEIQLPGDEDVIWAVGRVVRQSQQGVAVRFVRLADADRRRISEYVRGNLSHTKLAA